MQVPEFDLPISILDSAGYPMTDYAQSDAIEWIANVHRVMGFPRVMVLSDEIYDLLCRHPMISSEIRNGAVLTKCRTLFFRIIDVIIIADSTIMDCRESINKEYSFSGDKV